MIDELSYFFDVDVPTPDAPAIQILNTCRAMCDEGISVTAYLGRVRVPVDETLAYYGLSTHPLLRIESVYPGDARAWSAALAGRVTGRPTKRRAVLSRGEIGLRLFTLLRRLPRPPLETYLYEAHRPCFTEVPSFFDSRLPWARAGRVRLRTARVRRRERAVIAAMDGLVYLNEEVERALRDAFAPTAPGLILPSGATLGAPPPADNARDLDVLYAGKLLPRKGVHDLVAAMAHLPGRTLTVLGGGAERLGELEELSRRLGVSDRVRFVGWVSPVDADAYYRRARVGVCPLPEGESEIAERFTSPLKVPAMMAAGLPIVGTDLPSLRLLLKHEDTALLVPPSRPAELARAIERLLQDRAFAKSLSTRAFQVAQRHAWPARARLLLRFIRSLYGSEPGGRTPA